MYADTIEVGLRKLVIPSPHGFTRATDQMPSIYKLQLQTDDGRNEKLAFYINESDIPAAMTGELPSLERYFAIKTSKQFKDTIITSEEFVKLKQILRKSNRDIILSLQSKIEDQYKLMSKRISKEFDIDLAIKLEKYVLLEPHYETNDSISFSMYMKQEATAVENKIDYITSATTTIVKVKDKVLFLYCYGSKQDLEWTRNASRIWSNKILQNNY